MNAVVPPLAEVFPRADCLYDRDTLDAAIDRVGAGLTRALAGDRAVFLTVMKGGMFFASRLALAVGSDLEFDYAHATRYGHDVTGHEIEWLHRPHVPLAGRTVVLADDILDEGYTLKALRDYCLAEGARRVLSAVLCVKRHSRRIPGIDADFFGVEIPDRYVFGYGLDYYGQGRNARGLYAVAEADLHD